MKYKVGDKLKVKEGCEDECTAYYNNRSDASYIMIRGIDSDGDYQYDIYDQGGTFLSRCYCFEDEHLLPFEKTLENLEVGDVLFNGISGFERKVLAVVGNIVALSERNGFEAMDSWWTTQELKDRGYDLFQPESTPLETLEIGGHRYNKNEVEEALKDLEEVKD